MILGSSYRRGDVLMVRLDPVEGSEQGGTRPVVVVSNNDLNEVFPVLLIAPITSRKADRVYRTEVLVQAGEGGLGRVGKVLLHQLRTVALRRITRRMGRVNESTLSLIEEALHVTLDLR